MDFLFGIEVFRSVVDHGSFARAAVSLKLTPGMVSRHIAALEQEVGTRLFFRTTRRLALTDNGTLFLERCNKIHERINAASKTIFKSSAAVSGFVSVEVTNTMASSLITPVWHTFSTLYPNISLELNHTKNAYSESYEGFDVMFRLGVVDDPDVVKRRLGDPYSVVAASDAYLAEHKAIEHPRDLLDHDCIRYIDPITSEIRPWTFERDGDIQDFQVTGKLLFNQAESTVHAAVRGFGIVYTTNYHIDRYLRAGSLRRVLEEWSCPAPQLWLIYRKRSAITQAAHAFVEFIAGTYPEGKALVPPFSMSV